MLKPGSDIVGEEVLPGQSDDLKSVASNYNNNYNNNNNKNHETLWMMKFNLS